MVVERGKGCCGTGVSLRSDSENIRFTCVRLFCWNETNIFLIFLVAIFASTYEAIVSKEKFATQLNEASR